LEFQSQILQRYYRKVDTGHANLPNNISRGYPTPSGNISRGYPTPSGNISRGFPIPCGNTFREYPHPLATCRRVLTTLREKQGINYVYAKSCQHMLRNPSKGCQYTMEPYNKVSQRMPKNL
jgi:hypothetical protein